MPAIIAPKIPPLANASAMPESSVKTFPAIPPTASPTARERKGKHRSAGPQLAEFLHSRLACRRRLVLCFVVLPHRDDEIQRFPGRPAHPTGNAESARS